MDKEINLNYDNNLSSKSNWIRYFAEYKLTVDFFFESINGGEITVLSLL
jgi:hypothetical protein